VTLSHELNTPLNGILGAAELLQSDSDAMPPAERRELAGMIRTSGERLHRLVKRNLDFAQVQILGADRPREGGAEVTPAAGPLVEALGTRLARDHGRPADLVLDVATGIVLVPPHWLIRLATELLENAFKFSAPGSPVHVTVRFDEGRFRLSVRDAGRGMTGEQIAMIGPFLQFGRAHYSQQGVGLGLYLARRIAELHGGTLTVTSARGEGTSITVDLPAQP
jgi:signal transduction histidine kinase